MCIKGSHVIICVSAQSISDSPLLQLGKIIALPHIIEMFIFYHKMMKARLAGTQKSEAVMSFINMKKIHGALMNTIAQFSELAVLGTAIF